MQNSHYLYPYWRIENETFENFIHNDHYPGFEDHEMYMPADKYFKARYIKDLKT